MRNSIFNYYQNKAMTDLLEQERVNYTPDPTNDPEYYMIPAFMRIQAFQDYRDQEQYSMSQQDESCFGGMDI